MRQQYTNIAFISYKREDEKWAKWIQNKLEHYKLPTEIRKQNPSMEFAKNPRHVFKDTTDLSGGVLAKAIKEGLASSKYLIVICSPRAAKSKWVCKEVQDFIDSGREEYIVPFIIDGEPYAKNPENECFPEALKALAGERELLGININENGRDSAAVKVVARLFGLRFDTLWDRFQREARRRRRIVTSAFIAAIVFLLCIIAGGTYAYFEIQKERDRAKQETHRANQERDKAARFNVQLLEANDSILQAYKKLDLSERNLAKSNADLKESNIRLAEERDNVLKANRKIQSQQAELIEKNDILIEETKTISCLQDESRPYSFVGDLRGHGEDYLIDVAYHPSENIVAFIDMWGVWLHNLNTNTEVLLQDDDFSDATCYFSKSGDKLAVESRFGIFVWNVRTADLLAYFTFDEFPQSFEEEFETSIPEAKVGVNYKYNKGVLSIYNLKTQGCIGTTRIHPWDGSMNWGEKLSVVANPVFPEVAFVGMDKIVLYDSNKNAFVQFFQGYQSTEVSYSPSGEYLRIANNIFSRTNRVDTLIFTQIEAHPKSLFPKMCEEDSVKEKNATLSIDDNKIIYMDGKSIREILVVKEFTTGNGGEWLGDALYVAPDKIVAIVNQGLNRVYSTETSEEIGYLPNWRWLSKESLGREKILGHAEAYIYYTKCINRKLYVVSSAGVVRIYDIDKLRQECVFEFPVSATEDRVRTLEDCYITDDGKCIYYSFNEGKYCYKCILP